MRPGPRLGLGTETGRLRKPGKWEMRKMARAWLQEQGWEWVRDWASKGWATGNWQLATAVMVAAKNSVIMRKDARLAMKRKEGRKDEPAEEDEQIDQRMMYRRRLQDTTPDGFFSAVRGIETSSWERSRASGDGMSADGTSRQPADDNGDIESDESTDEGPAEVLVLKTLSSEASIPCRSGLARKQQLLLAKSQSQLEQQYQYQYLVSSMVISEEVHFAVINKL
uniref:GG17097 n=1 Tax=Drosophila erecta TaxID=7220 RepID=B3P465_DROER